MMRDHISYPNIDFEKRGEDMIPGTVEEKKTGTIYIIDEYLGKGGFATVFKAVRKHDNEVFAIKLIEKTKDSSSKRKIETEVSIHKKASHNNVVKVFSFFETAAFFCIVLELCEKETLSAIIKQKKNISEDDARIYISQLLDVLELMQSERIIHRDLKLSNLLLDSKKQLKLCDFGLAVIQTHPGQKKKGVCGTPNYIAPEIVDPKAPGYSNEVDIWSLGVLLYTFIIGMPPFQRREIHEIYKQIQSCTYNFPKMVKVSPEAKDLIRKLLKKNPSKRLTIPQIRDHKFMKITPPIPKAIIKPDLSKKAINPTFYSIHANLKDFFNGTLVKKSSIDTKKPYVVQWVDKTHKYGLGYLMSNGAIGVNYNDKTTIILYDGRFEYIYNKDGFKSIKKFDLIEEYESLDIEKKVKIILRFQKSFKKRKLSSSNEKSCYVVKSAFTRKCLIVRLNNNSVQAFFSDGSMMIVLNDGLYIGWRQKNVGIVKYANTNGLNDKNITARLKYVNDFLGSCLST
eukprot:GHVP01039000.1.p1 GENE.GHVP01039000.1~~GHVP01039000.1.p1  ORF type:complete len:512 (-),score=74.75 GHVP01039000.1:73-1608(-)